MKQFCNSSKYKNNLKKATTQDTLPKACFTIPPKGVPLAAKFSLSWHEMIPWHNHICDYHLYKHLGLQAVQNEYKPLKWLKLFLLIYWDIKKKSDQFEIKPSQHKEKFVSNLPKVGIFSCSPGG